MNTLRKICAFFWRPKRIMTVVFDSVDEKGSLTNLFEANRNGLLRRKYTVRELCSRTEFVSPEKSATDPNPSTKPDKEHSVRADVVKSVYLRDDASQEIITVSFKDARYFLRRNEEILAKRGGNPRGIPNVHHSKYE